MFEKLEFQGKVWKVCAKVEGKRVEDSNSLKENYGCDIVIKNNTHFFMLNEIIDAEYEEI